MERDKNPDWDDRFACAGVAFFVGIPTAFIAWLIALLVGAEFGASLHITWAFTIWGALVAIAFLFPHRMDALFGHIWEWLLNIIKVIVGGTQSW